MTRKHRRWDGRGEDMVSGTSKLGTLSTGKGFLLDLISGAGSDMVS